MKNIKVYWLTIVPRTMFVKSGIYRVQNHSKNALFEGEIDGSGVIRVRLKGATGIRNVAFPCYWPEYQFSDDWNVVGRRVLVEKVGFCI